MNEDNEMPTRMPQLDLREYLEVPLRHPWVVVVPTALMTLAALAYSFWVPKLYRSSTLIMVETQQVPQSFGLETGATRIDDRMTTVKQEILSRTRLERVLDEIEPYPDARRPRSATIENMRDATTVVTKGRDAFMISYVHRRPEVAQRVTERLATLFIAEVGETRSRQVEEASDFMKAQVEAAALALEQKEAAVRAFKERHMGSLPNQLNANLATLQRLQLEHQAVSESLRAARDRQVVVERNVSDQLRVAGSGASPVTDLPKLMDELATLRMRYTDAHPDVQSLLARIERTKASLKSEPPQTAVVDASPAVMAAREQLDQVHLEIATLQSQKQTLEQRMGELQWRVDQVPAREQELLSLTREYDQLQTNYSKLLEKKLSAEMAARLEHRWQGAHFSILDPASMPERPFYPSRLLFVLIGMVGGLGLGLALTFMIELFDHSIKSLSELEDLAPRPVLVSIPYVGSPTASAVVLRRFIGASDGRE